MLDARTNRLNGKPHSASLNGGKSLEPQYVVRFQHRPERIRQRTGIGDLARFPNPLFDDVPRRVEHWSIPGDTANRAAATLLGPHHNDAPFAPVPAFWSNQLDLRLQSYGSPALADAAHLEEGNVDDLTGGVILTYHRDHRHVGTVAVNLSPARLRELRDAFTAVQLPA